MTSLYNAGSLDGLQLRSKHHYLLLLEQVPVIDGPRKLSCKWIATTVTHLQISGFKSASIDNERVKYPDAVGLVILPDLQS